MPVHDEHKRLLGLIREQRWFRFSSDDNVLLQSLVYAGYVTAQLMSSPSSAKTRLVLTSKGVQYLNDLYARPERAGSALHYRRRSTDVPSAP